MAKRGKKDCDAALLMALAAGASVPGAAKQAQCSESTVRRRLSDPAFRARVSEMRGELVQAAVGRLAAIGAKAGDVFYELMGNADPRIRLGAARSVYLYMLSGQGQETLSRQAAEFGRRLEEAEKNELGIASQGVRPDGSPTSEAPESGDAAAGGAAKAGPGAGDDTGRDYAGPLASGGIEEEMDEGLAPLFETEREEPDSGRAGAG